MITSGRLQRNSATHIHVSILLQILLLCRLPHNIEQSSLCYKVGPCWLSILNTALCTCPSLPKKCYSLSCILSLPDSSVHGILQARILEWGAIPFSGGSSWPRDWTRVSYILGRFFTVLATRVSIPKSLTIPPTLSFPLATISLFSKSLSLFLFHKFICIIFF